MKNCLVTKLKVNVPNPNLEKLGQIVFHFDEVEDVSTVKNWVNLKFTENVKLKIVEGTGTFEPSGETTLDVPANTSTQVKVSNGASFYTDSKYNIVTLSSNPNQKQETSRNFWIDLKEMSYTTNLKEFVNNYTKVKGDIKNLENCTLLETFQLDTYGNESLIYGDISAFRNMTHLQNLLLNRNPRITGNIESLAGMSSLVLLHILDNSYVTGNVNALKNLNVTTFNFANTPLVYGEISDLNPNLEKCIIANASWISSSSRPSSSKIFSIGKMANFPTNNGTDLGDDLDNCLQNLINCQVPSGNVKITIKGTATNNTATLAQNLRNQKLNRQNDLVAVNGVVYNVTT